MNISVVIPLYNEEESINELVAWIAKVMYDNNFTYDASVNEYYGNDGRLKIEFDIINGVITEIKASFR